MYIFKCKFPLIVILHLFKRSCHNELVHAGNYSQQKIRNRWMVAYTLIRNPSLQCLTGSNLQVEKESKSENLSDESCGKNFPEVV